MMKLIYQRIPKTVSGLLLISLLAIIAVEIVLTCAIPLWREYFYNILQSKQSHLFHLSLGYFVLLMGGLGIVQGIKTWVGQLLSFEIRKAATKTLFSSWVKKGEEVKNYTTAMTDALRNSTEMYLEIVVEILISASIVIVLILQNLDKPTILVASLVYTVLVSAIAILFNRPLITSDMEWQSAEGAYREAISKIANGKGDYTSKEKFETLAYGYYVYIRVVMYFTLFTRVKSSLASLIPYLLLGASFFAGTITLGDFMSGVSTFELIVVNSTILLMLYPKLMKARASYNLSKEFYKEIVK